MLGDIHLDGSHIDFALDAHRDVIGIVGNPDGEGIGVFEDAVYHQFGFDFDATNFTKVGFDYFFAFECNGQAIDFIIDVNIHRELFSNGGVCVVEVSEVVNGRGDILGVLGDGEFALLVAQLAVVVIVNCNILVEIIIFPHSFGVSQWRLRFLINPAFKLIAHFICPIKAFYGFALNAKIVGCFAVDIRRGGANIHAHHTGIDCTIVDAIFKGFAGLIGQVCNFSSQYDW